MKYLLVSDIHGSLPALEKVLSLYEIEHCDMLCLLGDILNYGPRNGLPDGLDPQGICTRLNAMADHIVAVRGNCDSEVDQMLLHFPIMADYALLVDEGQRLFLTHGHKWNPDNLPPLGDTDYFFYGHTHIPYIQPADISTRTPLICNIGSPTFPKAGHPATCAIYQSGKVRLTEL